MVALPPAARDCSIALDASLPRAASSLHVRAAEPPSMAVATPTQLGGSPTLQKGGLDLFQSTPTQEPQTDDNGGDDNGGGKITNDGGGGDDDDDDDDYNFEDDDGDDDVRHFPRLSYLSLPVLSSPLSEPFNPYSCLG